MKRKLWTWNDKSNYGDLLSSTIFDYFNIDYTIERNEQNADTICIGSIIRVTHPKMTVLGSGLLFKNENFNPQADFRFVRGQVTRHFILKKGGKCPDVYGDPALLLPNIIEEQPKKYKIGIIPHYEDYNYVKLHHNHDGHIINILGDPLEICKEITKCEKIIASSLHGVITGHAYGIPTAWVKFPNSKMPGDDIKFLDHYSSIGLSPICSTIKTPFYTDAKYINLKNIVEIFEDLSYSLCKT